MIADLKIMHLFILLFLILRGSIFSAFPDIFHEFRIIYSGTLAKEIIEGLKLHFFDYQFRALVAIKPCNQVLSF